MNESTRRAFLHAGIGTLAVLGGCADQSTSNVNDDPTHTSTSKTTKTTEETTTRKSDAVSNEAIRWHAPCDGTPTVSDGTVYAGEHAMRAFDAESGTEKWQFTLVNPVCSSVTVGQKGIAFTTGKQGTVVPTEVAVHYLSLGGEEQFQYSKQRFSGIQNVLALTSDAMYVGFSDDYLQPTGHGVCALNYDGTERWATKTGDATGAEIHDELLFVPTPTRLYVIDRTSGETAWSFDTVNIWGETHVVGDLVLTLRSKDDENELVALDVTDGSVRWRFNEGDVRDPAYENGTVYVSHGEHRDRHEVSALDMKTGEKTWTKSPDSRIFAVESTANSIFVRTETGTRAFTSDGSRRWQIDTVGSMTATDETLYLSTDDSIYGFDPQTGTKRFELESDDPQVSHVGDVLLIRSGNRETLTALTPDGTVQWQFETGERLGYSTVTDDSVYVSGGDGYLYALDY